MALTQWQLKPVATDTIASGDFVAFTDENETGDPINKLTIDNLMETGIPLVTEDTIAVATDYILFLDGSSTGNTNKEQFSDVMTLIAGTGLSASSGVLNVDASQAGITTVGTIGTGVWEGTTVAVAQGGTGATSLSDLITLSTHTTGNYVATVTAGTNLTSSGATTGEGITHSLSVDDAFLKNDANDTTAGTITAAGFTTGNDGVLNFSDDLPSTDHAATGVTVTITSSTTLAKGVPVYISGSGTVAAADADLATTMPAIGINTTDLSGGAGEAEILLLGIWHDETYNFTAGADVFIGLDPASSTANSDVLGITTTAPTAAGDTVQKVGVVLTADTVFVNFTGTEILLA
jgi:hypothetical protein